MYVIQPLAERLPGIGYALSFTIHQGSREPILGIRFDEEATCDHDYEDVVVSVTASMVAAACLSDGLTTASWDPHQLELSGVGMAGMLAIMTCLVPAISRELAMVLGDDTIEADSLVLLPTRGRSVLPNLH